MYIMFAPENVAKSVFNDFPSDEALEWAGKLTWQSMAALGTPLTYAGYNDVSVSYVLVESDQLVTPENQKAYIANIEESSGNKVNVIKLDAGHFPHVTRTDELAEIIIKVANSM
jgi:homoserine acetyltransferase